MLTDLPLRWYDARRDGDRALIGLIYDQLEPVRVHRGVYLTHLNFHNEIHDLVMHNYPGFNPSDGYDPFFCDYGVVDHWTQLPIARLDADDRHFLVYLTRHAKAEQPERYGWRWHKWGPYLGVFKAQAADHEYLYDTPDVIEVFSYHVVELR